MAPCTDMANRTPKPFIGIEKGHLLGVLVFIRFGIVLVFYKIFITI